MQVIDTTKPMTGKLERKTRKSGFVRWANGWEEFIPLEHLVEFSADGVTWLEVRR